METRMDGQMKMDVLDSLCMEYWFKLADSFDRTSAQTIDEMITVYLKEIPMELMTDEMRTRLELHDLLKRVVEAVSSDSDDKKLFNELCVDLTELFDLLNCNMEAESSDKRDAGNVKDVLDLYRKFQSFENDHSLPDGTRVDQLEDGKFQFYISLLCELLRMVEMSQAYSFVQPTLSKEQLQVVFEECKTLREEIADCVIRKFCLALKFCHYKCGKPVYYEEVEESCLERNEDSSSYETVEESFMEKPPPKKLDHRGRKRFSRILTSTSPPKKQERIPKFKGSFWDDDDDDIMSTVSITSTRKIKWTSEETANLVAGYKRYGTQWASIRVDPAYKLQHKTNIQLKDRWRNLVKKGDVKLPK